MMNKRALDWLIVKMTGPLKKKRFWLGESLNRGLSLTMEIELARKRATIYP